jgi:hypothetical protein
MQAQTEHHTRSAKSWIQLAICRISSLPVMHATMWKMQAMYSRAIMVPMMQLSHLVV